MTDSTACPYCGKPLSNHHAAKTCGDPACRRLHANAKQVEWMAAHPGYRRRYAKYPNGPKYAKVCTVCGSDYRTHHADSPYCSVECMGRAYRHTEIILHPNPAPACVLHPQHVARRWQPSTSGRLWVMRWCARCGEPFVIVDQLQARYCSSACQGRDNKSKRRARKRNAHRVAYRRVDIFERDNWVCHICGRKTKSSAPINHPLAPTIDHLVPLSKGGADAPFNVACAHRQCNSIKSDTGAAQLRLLG
jgi:5-methylcytosine-specific restriction endonuclease McrA